jgi:hypothetical protein
VIELLIDGAGSMKSLILRLCRVLADHGIAGDPEHEDAPSARQKSVFRIGRTSSIFSEPAVTAPLALLRRGFCGPLG